MRLNTVLNSCMVCKFVILKDGRYVPILFPFANHCFGIWNACYISTSHNYIPYPEHEVRWVIASKTCCGMSFTQFRIGVQPSRQRALDNVLRCLGNVGAQEKQGYWSSNPDHLKSTCLVPAIVSYHICIIYFNSTPSLPDLSLQISPSKPFLPDLSFQTFPSKFLLQNLSFQTFSSVSTIWKLLGCFHLHQVGWP